MHRRCRVTEAVFSSAETLSHDAQLPVAVMIASPGQARATDAMLWQISGVVAGQQFASAERSCACVRSTPEAELFFWRGFTIRLHPAQAEDYALNLGSENPQLFVISRFDAERGVEPLEITASLDHAQALDCTNLRNAEDIVLPVAMPNEVAAWIETFVATHYEPRRRGGGKGRGKRRSKALYDAAVGDWAGDEA